VTYKLADFGAATYFEIGQVFSERIGSTSYIAPEVLKQQCVDVF
jgi:serine/threonine protein kinase